MQHQEKKRMLQKKKSTATSGENLVQQRKNKIKHLKNCSATSEKRMLQQPKKGTIATFHIICCNIKNESL